jgi:hypothetical protein
MSNKEQQLTGSHGMNRSLTAHQLLHGGGSEAPYVPGYPEPVNVGLNLPAADDLSFDSKYLGRAYEPADYARRSFDSFSFAGQPSAEGSWNMPSTPDLATDESSFYSSAMSRSTSLVSSYLPTDLTGNVGTPWPLNEPFASDKTQFNYIGTVFDKPVSPSDDMFSMATMSYAAPSAAPEHGMLFSSVDMSRSMSSTTTSSDLLTSIAYAPHADADASPRRRAPSPRSGDGAASPASPSSQRKMEIPRVRRLSVRHVESNHHGLLCGQCDRNPDGFRGDHELMRHKRLFHSQTTVKWVCADLRTEGGLETGSDWSRPKLGLDQCQNCRSGKQYGQYYNAAAQ